MVQEQIVDYINAQMKLGVSRDAIKATLTGAGWVAADVEDTLKKIEGVAAAQPIAAISASPAAMAMPASMPASVASPAHPAPQTIKVSDLVSPVSSPSQPAKPSTFTAAPVSMSSMSKSPLTGPAVSAAMPAGMKSSNTYTAPASAMSKPHGGSHGALITDIVLVVIILAVGGLAGFLYMQNNSLNAQLGNLNGQSSGVTSQLSALQAQVAASTTALSAQVASLSQETQELQNELSFYVPPSGSATGATSSVVVSGVVSGGGKLPYVITATYGAKIYVTNSKVAAVIAALAPLMGTAGATPAASSSTPAGPGAATSTPPTSAPTPSSAPSTAQFSGIYVPGSDSITLTLVNGTAL